MQNEPETKRGWQRLAGGDVQITLSPDDWDLLVMALSYATFASMRYPDGPLKPKRLFGLVNRVNAGHPDFTPYEVQE